MIDRKHTPIIISVTVVLTVLGILSGLNLPNALLPKIKRPEIRLFVGWPGKGAQEIEQSLIAPLERQLQGLENLLSMESEIYSDGGARINLEFHSDTDMQNSYIEVLSRVNQVPGWPPEVARPFVRNAAAGLATTLATAMLFSTTQKTEGELIHAYEAFVEPALSTIRGVSQLQASTDQRVDIEFDPVQLSRYSLSIDEVSGRLRELRDRSGDSLTLGSRDYALHFKGQIPLKELKNFAITQQGEHIIRLGELASIHTRPASDWHYASIMGNRAMYFRFRPTADANALESIDLIKQAIVSLNDGPLAQLGMEVVLSRDDSREIRQALTLVYGNLILGIVLASAVLFYFLRNWSVVGLVCISIPICLSMVMLAMAIGGYSLNIISLAGMALSVGLLLDAAIVVVENIVRLRLQGLVVSEAVMQGTEQVKGAIISSTLSSIIIFVPILMMDSSESQLFADLAFTISTALVASILVALILLPSLCRHFLVRDISSHEGDSDVWVSRLAAPARQPALAVATIVLAIPAALVFTAISMPSIDVLPDPKQRIIRSRISFNEPLSSQAAEASVAQVVFSRIKAQQALGEAPDFEVYGLFCSEENCLVYFYPPENWDYASFEQWLNTRVVHDLPGTRTYTHQASLLRFANPDGRLTQIDIKGGSLEELQLAGRELLGHLQETFPDAEIEEGSPLYNQASRIEFTPKQDSLVRLGMSQAQLNRQLVALTDGLYLGRFYAEGDTLPFYFKGQDVLHLDALMKIQIMVPGHGLVALSQLVDARITTAPAALLRINREASVSLELTPAQNQAVGPFMDAVMNEVSQFLSGDQYSSLYVGYRGSADRLRIFLSEFGKMFLVSLMVLALLMRLTLKSWKLAIAVLLSMPLAIAGGMLSLRALNLFTPQNLDVISMIGFIILMGLVINNAILLANEFNESTRTSRSQYEAIVQSIKLRRRPIYMSTGTSIFGMLPLMLSPGEGAEIYRGLAAVIIGGMSASALFSMSFMAALLSLPVFAAKSEKPVAATPPAEDQFVG